MTDREIVELYWARAESAIEETQRRLGAYLTTIARNVLGSEEDAGECVNDAYLAAWNTIPPARPAALAPFLGRLVRQRAIDRLRTNTRQKRLPSEGVESLAELAECVPDAGAGEMCDALALREAINAYLRTLPRDARLVFTGRYYYMDSLEEVARYCGMTVSRAKSLLFRARKGLRAYLEKEGLL